MSWEKINLVAPKIGKKIIIAWKDENDLKSAIITLKIRIDKNQFEDLYLAESSTCVGNVFPQFQYRLSDFPHHKWIYLPELD